MDNLIVSALPEPEVPQKKRMKPAVVISIIVFLLITIPLTGFAVKNTLELRSKACSTDDFACRHNNTDPVDYIKTENTDKKMRDDEDVHNVTTAEVNAEIAKAAAAAEAARAAAAAAKAAVNPTVEIVPGTWKGIDSCGQMRDESAVRCQTNPPKELTITKNADGSTTTIIVGYTYNDDLTPNRTDAGLFTLTTTVKDGKIISSTVVNNAENAVNLDNASCGRNLDMNSPVCCAQSILSDQKGGCESSGGTKVCEGSNRLECNIGGKHCTIDADGCVDKKPRDDKQPKNPTPTPTPTTAPKCVAIVAYKDGNALSASELSALHVGDTITLAFVPNGAATNVRFRVNSGDWHETTTKNANSQFVWDYSLENVSNFEIEAEWFDGTSWH